VNDRGGNGAGCFEIKIWTDAAKKFRFEVLGVKRLADIQDDIACKGVCVNEKHSRNRERRPAYSSSGSGSGVVLRHRAAAAACACLRVDAAAAAAYCMQAGGRSPD